MLRSGTVLLDRYVVQKWDLMGPIAALVIAGTLIGVKSTCSWYQHYASRRCYEAVMSGSATYDCIAHRIVAWEVFALSAKVAWWLAIAGVVSLILGLLCNYFASHFNPKTLRILLCTSGAISIYCVGEILTIGGFWLVLYRY